MHVRARAAVPAMVALSITFAFLPPAAHAQSGPMSIGSVGGVTQLHTCPSGIFSPPPPATQTVCYQATVSCPNTNEITVTFSYVGPANPTGTNRESYETVLPDAIAKGSFGHG